LLTKKLADVTASSVPSSDPVVAMSDDLRAKLEAEKEELLKSRDALNIETQVSWF
jgi:hypothetical protein